MCCIPDFSSVPVSTVTSGGAPHLPQLLLTTSSCQSLCQLCLLELAANPTEVSPKVTVNHEEKRGRSRNPRHGVSQYHRALMGPVTGHRNECDALLMPTVWGMGRITNAAEDRGPLVTALGIMAGAQRWPAVAEGKEGRLTWVSPMGGRKR